MDRQTARRILGVGIEASEADIKAARNKLVLKWHPDKNGSDEAHTRTQEVLEAISVLNKPDPWHGYDPLWRTFFEGQQEKAKRTADALAAQLKRQKEADALARQKEAAARSVQERLQKEAAERRA